MGMVGDQLKMRRAMKEAGEPEPGDAPAPPPAADNSKFFKPAAPLSAEAAALKQRKLIEMLRRRDAP